MDGKYVELCRIPIAPEDGDLLKTPVVWEGEELPLLEAARRANISPFALYRCHRAGWQPEEARLLAGAESRALVAFARLVEVLGLELVERRPLWDLRHRYGEMQAMANISRKRMSAFAAGGAGDSLRVRDYDVELLMLLPLPGPEQTWLGGGKLLTRGEVSLLEGLKKASLSLPLDLEEELLVHVFLDVPGPQPLPVAPDGGLLLGREAVARLLELTAGRVTPEQNARVFLHLEETLLK